MARSCRVASTAGATIVIENGKLVTVSDDSRR